MSLLGQAAGVEDTASTAAVVAAVVVVAGIVLVEDMRVVIVATVEGVGIVGRGLEADTTP